MKNLSDKVVWITGASSGIGEALAMAFSKEGAILILSSRRKEELERVKTLCRLDDKKCLVLPFDLGDTSEINKLTERVIGQFGNVDILVNSGGISQRSLVQNTSIAIDRKIMEVNFFGAVAVTKSILPYMLQQKNGHIVVVSSIAGKFGFFLRSGYSASKHALHGFFESLRAEVFRDNIKISIICPGKIKTNISLNAINEKGEKNNKPDTYTRKELTADECALQIMDAIKKDRVETFIGGKELKAIWIKRFFPKLFFSLILKEKF
jgi:short-subunit dehydrogenase